MEEIFILLGIGTALILSLIAEYLFRKTRIPDVLLLMLFGAGLSIFGFTDGLKQADKVVNLLITFSLIYIAFNGGLSTRLKEVFSTAKWTLISSFLNFAGISIVITLFALLFQFPLKSAIAIGFLLCVVDGAIVERVIEVIKLSKKAETFIQMEAALIDVFVIISIITLINFSSSSISDVFQNLMNFVFLSSILGAIFGFGWSFLIKKLSFSEHMSITTMAVLTIVYVVAEYFNANGGIAIFVFSVILGNSNLIKGMLNKEYAEKVGDVSAEEKFFFNNLTFFLKTMLFVYMGALVDFSRYYYLFLGLLFAVLSFVARSFIYKLIHEDELIRKDKHVMESLAVKGITPIVLVSLMRTSPEVTNTVLGAIFFSVIISSIMIYYIEKEKFVSPSDIVLKFPKILIHKIKRKKVKTSAVE